VLQVEHISQKRRPTPSLKAKRDRGEMELRRQRGLSMPAKGRSPSEIARALGITPQAVREWSAAYHSSGKKALL
jgi:DNA invertase Pin-like site-specific DNA recombinase